LPAPRSFPTRRSSDLGNLIQFSRRIPTRIPKFFALRQPTVTHITPKRYVKITYTSDSDAVCSDACCSMIRNIMSGVQTVAMAFRSEEHTSELQSRFDL